MLDAPRHAAAETTRSKGRPVETGIAPDDMYRMSRLFCGDIGKFSLSLDAHRLLHALLHRTYRGLPVWSPGIRQPEEGYRMRCIALRKAVGLEPANGNRNLRAGIADLETRRIFQSIRFLYGNEFMEWRFRDNVLDAILDDDGYGLFDASALPSLKTATDYHICNHVSVARRMRKPEFTFTVAHAGIWADRDDARWSDVSDGVVSALRTCCGHYGLEAYVLLDRFGLLRGIDTVTIRLRGSGSAWPSGLLTKVNFETSKCLLVDGTGHRFERRQDFPDLAPRKRGGHTRVCDLL